VSSYGNEQHHVGDYGVDVVKLEGEQEFVPTAKVIVNAGIPVVGRIGLILTSIPLPKSFMIALRLAG